MRDSDYNIVVCTNSSYAKYIPVLFNSISFHTKAGIAFYVVYSRHYGRSRNTHKGQHEALILRIQLNSLNSIQKTNCGNGKG